MDFRLDGITLSEIISMMYCGKCNESLNIRKEQMKEETNLKQLSESFYLGGTTKELYCPKCFNKIKICIPNDSVFWNILDKSL